jgi:hypothetical protein
MSISQMPMTFTVTLQMTDREREQFLENLQNHSQKKVEREDEIKIKQDAGEHLSVRVVWINGKEYLSTRDVVRHTTEKTGKLVVKAWTQVKDRVDAGMLATHKFKGSGEVVQDVIERGAAGRVVLALTGEAAQRNRERMLAAIAGDNSLGDQGVTCKNDGGRVAGRVGQNVSYIMAWLERITGQPGAKRARRA